MFVWLPHSSLSQSLTIAYSFSLLFLLDVQTWQYLLLRWRQHYKLSQSAIVRKASPSLILRPLSKKISNHALIWEIERRCACSRGSACFSLRALECASIRLRHHEQWKKEFIFFTKQNHTINYNCVVALHIVTCWTKARRVGNCDPSIQLSIHPSSLYLAQPTFTI